MTIKTHTVKYVYFLIVAEYFVNSRYGSVLKFAEFYLTTLISIALHRNMQIIIMESTEQVVLPSGDQLINKL